MAAEFAGKRPVCTYRVFYENTYVNAWTRSVLCNFLKIVLAVCRKHADTLVVEIFNVLCLFDCVSVRKSVRRNIKFWNHIQLIAGSNIKIWAHLSEHFKNRLTWVWFHCVIDTRIRERISKSDVVLLDCVEIDYDIWGFQIFRKVEKTLPVLITDIVVTIKHPNHLYINDINEKYGQRRHAAYV